MSRCACPASQDRRDLPHEAVSRGTTMDEVILRGGAYYLVAFIAFFGAITGVDTGFSVHMWIVMAAALLATVAGLGVAIPALFGYNYLGSRIKELEADMQVFADELLARIGEVHGA